MRKSPPKRIRHGERRLREGTRGRRIQPHLFRHAVGCAKRAENIGSYAYPGQCGGGNRSGKCCRHAFQRGFDLRCAGESLDDWRVSVRTAIDLGVDHISAYALTVAPNTKMGRQIAVGTLPTPDDDDEATKYEIADDLLSAAGLEWYEISNWARPGYESQHNLGYWRNVDWAGLGPGAHSHYGNVMDVEQSASAETSETVKSSGLRSWILRILACGAGYQR